MLRICVCVCLGVGMCMCVLLCSEMNLPMHTAMRIHTYIYILGPSPRGAPVSLDLTAEAV